MVIALVGSPTRTNVELASAWRPLGLDARILWAGEAVDVLRPGDVALVRLDVLPTLDGVEPGLDLVARLEELGVRVLNRPEALLATHDKLVTAACLREQGVPHPRTEPVEPGGTLPEVSLPCVVKPRFGSWGEDVHLCHTAADVRRTLDEVAARPWWRRHGALVQEFVESARSDLRIVVAGGRAVAGATRTAAAGDWRTNVTLGGTLSRAPIPGAAAELALRAAAATGIDFGGVDLLPGTDGWTVLELNGAVDFDTRYALPGSDPYAAILDALDLRAPGAAPGRVPAALAAAAAEPAAVGAELLRAGVRPRIGDVLAISARSTGHTSRAATILDVLDRRGRPRFRVRWEDGHESIYTPGEGVRILPPGQGRARPAA